MTQNYSEVTDRRPDVNTAINRTGAHPQIDSNDHCCLPVHPRMGGRGCIGVVWRTEGLAIKWAQTTGETSTTTLYFIVSYSFIRQGKENMTISTG